jgi:hypothetical protein
LLKNAYIDARRRRVKNLNMPIVGLLAACYVLRAGPTGLTHTMCKKSQELMPNEGRLGTIQRVMTKRSRRL